MANLFLRSSDGSDADNGTTWALAKATLAGALAIAAAGDTIYVSDNHSETGAVDLTLTSPGTAAAPVRVICVDDAGDPATPTTLATTAVFTTTGGSDILFAGFAYVYGITFNCSTGAGSATLGITAATPFWWGFERCALKILNTSASSLMAWGALSGSVDDMRVELIDTDLKFGNAGQGLNIRAPFIWAGGSLLSGTVPTILFKGLGGNVAPAYLSNVDLSNLTGTIVDVNGGSTFVLTLSRCKLGAGVALTSGGAVGQGGPRVRMDACDSGDTNYRFQHFSFEGSVYSETVIVRTSGASDGTTPLSWKMVSSANPEFFHPLESPRIAIWNDTTGSAKTLTVEIIHDSVTALTDEEVWLEVDYLGTSGFPLGLTGSDRKASIVATAAAQASSSVAWTTTGITNVNKQKLEVTITPQEKGPFLVRVMLAKVSYTVYVDPLVTVT